MKTLKWIVEKLNYSNYCNHLFPLHFGGSFLCWIIFVIAFWPRSMESTTQIAIYYVICSITFCGLIVQIYFHLSDVFSSEIEEWKRKFTN